MGIVEISLPKLKSAGFDSKWKALGASQSVEPRQKMKRKADLDHKW